MLDRKKQAFTLAETIVLLLTIAIIITATRNLSSNVSSDAVGAWKKFNCNNFNGNNFNGNNFNGNNFNGNNFNGIYFSNNNQRKVAIGINSDLMSKLTIAKSSSDKPFIQLADVDQNQTSVRQTYPVSLFGNKNRTVGVDSQYYGGSSLPKKSTGFGSGSLNFGSETTILSAEQTIELVENTNTKKIVKETGIKKSVFITNDLLQAVKNLKGNVSYNNNDNYNNNYITLLGRNSYLKEGRIQLGNRFYLDEATKSLSIGNSGSYADNTISIKTSVGIPPENSIIIMPSLMNQNASSIDGTTNDIYFLTGYHIRGKIYLSNVIVMYPSFTASSGNYKHQYFGMYNANLANCANYSFYNGGLTSNNMPRMLFGVPLLQDSKPVSACLPKVGYDILIGRNGDLSGVVIGMSQIPYDPEPTNLSLLMPVVRGGICIFNKNFGVQRSTISDTTNYVYPFLYPILIPNAPAYNNNPDPSYNNYGVSQFLETNNKGHLGTIYLFNKLLCDYQFDVDSDFFTTLSTTDDIRDKNLQFVANDLFNLKIDANKIYATEVQSSDARLKNIYCDSKLGLKELEEIKISEYSFKSDIFQRRHVGVIAQQVEKICSNFVDKSEKFWSIKIDQILYLMVNAIKTLNLSLDKIEARQKILNQKLDTIEKRIDKLYE